MLFGANNLVFLDWYFVSSFFCQIFFFAFTLICTFATFLAAVLANLRRFFAAASFSVSATTIPFGSVSSFAALRPPTSKLKACLICLLFVLYIL